MLTAIVGYGYLTGYGDQAVIFAGVLDRLTVLRCRFGPSFFAPISSSIQVGAWSLARGRSRTQRSTPALRSRGASLALSKR